MAAKKGPKRPKTNSLIIKGERSVARGEKSKIRSTNKKVASTMKTFSDYASAGGKLKKGSKGYEKRLGQLTSGIKQRKIADAKKSAR